MSAADFDAARIVALLGMVERPVAPERVEDACVTVNLHLVALREQHGSAASIGLAGALLSGVAQFLHDHQGHAAVLRMFRPFADAAETELKALLDVASLPAASEARQ